ncbi:hypothetical protein [Algibacter sp. PT7-4]|uniref:hypothetical protein n=1 Tax=Algibacter ulvanivorans TaxID=3400999 RepID=UPI003AADFF07
MNNGTEKSTVYNTVYKKLLFLAKSKGRCTFATSDFPSENPRTQTRNFPYTNTLYAIKNQNMNQARTIATMTFLFISCLIYSQTTTTESKSCGACGKAVSIYSKVGDTCPHCGVRWGDENTRTTTVTKPSYTLPRTNYPSYSNTNTFPKKTVEKKKPNPFASKSKDYTIKWLNDKLNTYKQNYLSCSSDFGTYNCLEYKDYDFKFQDGYLIVKYNYKENDIVNYIPLYDINYAYGKSYSDDFSISTNAKTIVSINKTTGKKEFDNYIQIGFEATRESGLMDKVILAFEKISSVSTKPSSSSLPNYTTEMDTNRPTSYETKEWIISKFRKYGSSEYTYQISGWNLIMQKDINNNYYGRTYTIPLCDCSVYKIDNRYNFNKKENFAISSRNKSIINKSNYKNKVFYNQKVEIVFELGREKDLVDRINKALNNLKYYCPKKTVTKEKF